MNQLKKQQSGFTLVEIAIVLVIIGLLLGGVLKGQELINSAKVKNMIGDFRTVSSLVYGYQDRFKAFPGDQSQAQLDAIAFGAAWRCLRPCRCRLAARRTTGASTASGMPAGLTAPVSPPTKASSSGSTCGSPTCLHGPDRP
jgi:prepilin-type N-terminal cleavage/methylation domain-containing protein